MGICFFYSFAFRHEVLYDHFELGMVLNSSDDMYSCHHMCMCTQRLAHTAPRAIVEKPHSLMHKHPWGRLFFVSRLLGLVYAAGRGENEKKHTEHERVHFWLRLSTRGLPYTHAARSIRYLEKPPRCFYVANRSHDLNILCV